ncbi:hypothetical protein VUR80DRAFT_8946 [Thermomyces stellatus]
MAPVKDDSDAIHLETARGPDQAAAADAPARSTPSKPSSPGRDKAAQLLKQAPHPITVTPASNARVLRKIDLRLLPLLLVVYCLQSLDKTTLSYTSVFGLIEDTGLVGDQFSWLGSVVYLAQLVFQPLVAYSLVRFPIGKFSATMVFCWGAVLCGMTAARDFGGLMASRLLLGAFEASVGMWLFSFGDFRRRLSPLYRCGTGGGSRQRGTRAGTPCWGWSTW